MQKIKSLNDAYSRAKDGDERYQRLMIAALQNLGCEHLGNQHKRDGVQKWQAYFRGLASYVDALICEYGLSESAAFREVRDEINHVMDCIDNVNLEWEPS